MFYDYVLDDDTYLTIKQKGVVLQNSMFQLFDLERDRVNWNTYPEFKEVPNPRYDPKYDVATNTSYDNNEMMWRGSYGVCDDLENLLKVYPELEAEGRTFVVSMTLIARADQEDYGGWRWHKWGAYIGNYNPTCEYLYDEPIIDSVYCYHIYEKIT